MDEWRPHQISPPEEDEFEELERRRQRRARERRWVGPVLAGLGVAVVGAMTFSVCSGSDSSLEAQRVAGPNDAEVRDALEAGLETPPAYPTAAEAAASGEAADAAEAQPALPDVAAPPPPTATAPAAVPKPPAASSAPAPPAPGPAPEAKPAAPPAAKPPQVASLAPVAKSPPAPGSYSVQLASVRDPSHTTALWESALAANPDLFTGLTPTVQRADLGERGVYHRLRVGPFGSRAAAEQTCSLYQARGGSCLVVTN